MRLMERNQYYQLKQKKSLSSEENELDNNQEEKSYKKKV